MTGPLFKWFGSKWLSSSRLPVPHSETIFEPFAGGAGYSLRYCRRNVFLTEKDPHIALLWRWLIREAKPSDILDIPIGTPKGTDIHSLGLDWGQELLLKSWQRTNNVGNCWTISPWGNLPGQWTANTRARIADEIMEIKHWKFLGGDGFGLLTSVREPATCLVDPPYERNYSYKQPPINYAYLAKLCRELPGQVIACEAADPKTGAEPTWLPFSHFGDRVTSRRKVGEHHHSRELIWHNINHSVPEER
jgi:hypothetical protein